MVVLDSGIADHQDLTSTGKRVQLSFGFVPTEFLATDDKFGHGTHVAGIIAGNGGICSNGSGNNAVRGMAPGVNLINFRVLDSNGLGMDSTVILAIEAAIALKPLYNIRVINLSMGRSVTGSYKNDPLCSAVEQAWNAGIVVVAAAGNGGRSNPTGSQGYFTITAPGNDPRVITVGAINTMGTAPR